MRNLLCLFAVSTVPCIAGCITINVSGENQNQGEGVTVAASVGATGSGSGGAGGSGGATSSSSTAETTSSSSSSSATGTGGGGPVSLFEACPGSPISVTAGNSITVTGTTTGAHDDYKTYCADSDASTSAPDLVYQLGLPDDCTLTISLTGAGGFQPAFSFRPTCDVDAGTCINTTVDGNTFKMATAGGYYALVVDGANGTSGDFSLQITCDAPTCGDGIVNTPSEQCDGGPGATPLDGCGDPGSAGACQISATQAADKCADVVPVSVSPGSVMFPASPPAFNSIGATDDYHSIDPACTPLPAVDQVFGFTPTTSGTLTITTGNDADGVTPICNEDGPPAGCWNHTLYLREGACETGTELTCSYPTFDGDNGVNSVTAEVTAGTTYYLFIDGSDMTIYDAGPYFLQVSLQ